MTAIVTLVVLLLACAGGAYGYLRYRYDQIQKITVAKERKVAPSQPVNILVIGSDSRVGAKAATGFGTTATVAGQRSDVIMVWHLVPSTGKITVLSLPATTLTQMVGKAATQFGRFAKVNVAYNDGATLLVQTIQSNFGIPINHVVQVDFAGFKGAVNALGGVYMDFEYPAKDTYSGLDITRSGCQLLNGTQALAVARSQDFEYYKTGRWNSTPLGDLARIRREDAFLKALVDTAKSKLLSPLQLNAFLGSLPQGIEVDRTFTLGEMVGLAKDFRSVTPGSIAAYTLPTLTGGNVPGYGDVLFVNQPADQALLTAIFGSELTAPASPPPNEAMQPEPPPANVTPSTSVQATAPNVYSSAELDTTPTYDPTACSP